jgi:hypothetical protein
MNRYFERSYPPSVDAKETRPCSPPHYRCIIYALGLTCSKTFRDITSTWAWGSMTIVFGLWISIMERQTLMTSTAFHACECGVERFVRGTPSTSCEAQRKCSVIAEIGLGVSRFVMMVLTNVECVDD